MFDYLLLETLCVQNLFIEAVLFVMDAVGYNVKHYTDVWFFFVHTFLSSAALDL